MKNRPYLILVIFLFILYAVPVWAANDNAASGITKKSADDAKLVDKDYVLGPGDQLEISVWKDDALNKVVTVLPDGKIYFPLIGAVNAGGKTVAQVKKELEKSLSSYVTDLILSVDVKQVNSMLVYVIGRVNTPGRLILNANVNVLQALAIAGGPNPLARRSRIRIFRPEGAETKVFKFDYDDVSDGDHMEQNIILKRGDIIYVP